MQIRQADKHMQTSLSGISKRARRDKTHRFGNLYGLLNEKNLHWCLPHLNKKASCGVDRISWQEFKVTEYPQLELLLIGKSLHLVRREQY
ncbi:hypothetical protein JW960_18785 [candidate division KSB1 bacterium]|nr:hypothetical protein [candidate division KSB1 bacterium]